MLSPQRMLMGKRFDSKNNDLTEEEKQMLLKKLSATFNEKQVEASSFARFVTPHVKFGPPRIMSYDWTLKSMAAWYGRKKVEFHKYNQRYIKDRVKSLGSDIAVAHFIVYRGGAIRFRGQDNFIQWTDKKEEYMSNLPVNYEPNYFVEAIDASNLAFYYEGMENFKNLYKLKWLSFKNNPFLDNWCIDYIGHAVPHLEYLNICDCPRVTAAGIAGLQKLTQLKELVINSDNIEIQMACFALEDTIPGLFVSLQDTNNIKLPDKEEKLDIGVVKSN